MKGRKEEEEEEQEDLPTEERRVGPDSICDHRNSEH